MSGGKPTSRSACGTPVRGTVPRAGSASSGSLLVGRLDVEKMGDGREVLEVVGEQGRAVNFGCCSDREVRGAPAWLSPARCYDGLKPTPFTRDAVIDGQWIWEAGLNGAQSSRPDRPCLVVAGNKQPEVQLGDRYDTDRSFDLVGERTPTDQHRGVKDGTHLSRPRVAQRSVKPRKILGKLWIGRQVPQV